MKFLFMILAFVSFVGVSAPAFSQDAWFFTQLDDLEQSKLSNGKWNVNRVGKTQATWTVGTTGNECGNTYDGDDYVASTKFTGLVYCARYMFASVSNGQKALFVSMCSNVDHPASVKFADVDEYYELEGVSPGICHDDGAGGSAITYYKYAGTIQ